MRDSLDRTEFDVDELSLELAFEEPEAIIALVREEIAFEQYPGLLRGAQGTLVSGAGNALDQAVLLATLLGAAGFDTRIASGRLSTEHAEQLLESMQPTATSRAAAPISTESADELAALIGVDKGALATTTDELEADLGRLRDEADTVARRLEASVRNAGLFTSEAVVPTLVEEARDYHWVEYGLGGDEWTAAHVLFDVGEVVAVEATGYLVDSVPEELQHRFRFQVFVEQRLGDELVVKPVTAAWERPAANMFGVGLSYVSFPDGFAADGVGAEGVGPDIDAVLDATTFFMPVFNGALAEGALSFDLDGNTVSPLDAGNQAAGVVKNVGGAFGRAAGALAAEPDPDAFVALTAQWIEYTMVAPGGDETVHRRTIFDRVADRGGGEVALDPEVTDDDVARALATTFTFMLDTGHYSDAFVTDRGVDVTLAAEPMLSAAVAAVADGDVDEPVVTSAYQEASRGIDLLRLYGAFDDAPSAPARISYRAEPSLVVIERPFSGEWARVDVVNNSRRVLKHVDGSLPTVDVAGAIEVGAWETRVEGMPIASGATSRYNPYSLLDAAWQADAMTVLAPRDKELAATLDLPRASRSAIAEDLGRGYAVVVPTASVDELQAVAWWRVDPTTGETLGRGADGRGNELTEYEEMLAVESALMKGGLVISAHTLVLGCLGKGGWETACCLFEGTLVNVGMIAIGAMLAAYFAIPALALFLLLDIGVGGAMTVAGFMNAMPSMCSAGAGTCRVRDVV